MLHIFIPNIISLYAGMFIHFLAEKVLITTYDASSQNTSFINLPGGY
jgi:hypothetical protein